MKEEALELYREGLTANEIYIELDSLAYATIQAYITSSDLRHDSNVQEAQLRHKIQKLLSEYQEKFGKFNIIP